jgi:hypothetical protein
MILIEATATILLAVRLTASPPLTAHVLDEGNLASEGPRLFTV